MNERYRPSLVLGEPTGNLTGPQKPSSGHKETSVFLTKQREPVLISGSEVCSLQSLTEEVELPGARGSREPEHRGHSGAGRRSQFGQRRLAGVIMSQSTGHLLCSAATHSLLPPEQVHHHPQPEVQPFRAQQRNIITMVYSDHLPKSQSTQVPQRHKPTFCRQETKLTLIRRWV